MAGVAAGASAATPVRARVPGDSVAIKKKEGRVVDAKSVTQLNSVRVSFVNRKENGGSLAKAPATRGSPRVGPLSREWAAAWATLVCACGSLWWAEPRRELGHTVEYIFQFSRELQRFIQYSFLAAL